MVKITVETVRISRNGSVSLRGVEIVSVQSNRPTDEASSEVRDAFSTLFLFAQPLADPGPPEDCEPFFGGEAEAAEGMPRLPGPEDEAACEARDAELIRRFEEDSSEDAPGP